MNILLVDNPQRRAAVHGLAVVGFIALVVVAVSLAVYSARFIPEVANRIGAAAVSLGSTFRPASTPTLSVVSTPIVSTTISFGTNPTASSTNTTPTPPKVSIPYTPAAPTAGNKINTTQQISGATTTAALYGFADLVVRVDAVGYLTTTSADSFVASSTVPSGKSPAARFTIKNIGTNATGAWRWSASIPTSSNYLYLSQPQQTLSPGDYIEYTFGFTQAIPGTGKMISITANFDHAIQESNTDNNSASATVTVLGS